MKKVAKTGKRRTRREVLLLMTGVELTAIVKVERYKTSPKNAHITIYCKALDSFGFVYDLQLKLSPENMEHKENILTDLKEGSIHLVKGQHCVFKRDYIGILSDPEYMPLPQDLSEEDIRMNFRINLAYKKEPLKKGESNSERSFCLPYIVFHSKK